MDGKIEVASRQGEGSTFRFYVAASLQKFSGDGILPSPLDLDAPQSLMDEQKRKTEDASRDLHVAKLRTEDSLRVLIVEDNLINQKGKLFLLHLLYSLMEADPSLPPLSSQFSSDSSSKLA